MERIICLAIGYVCGLLQSGYLVRKIASYRYQKVRERKCRVNECTARDGMESRDL